jgi:hypothetical protein
MRLHHLYRLAMVMATGGLVFQVASSCIGQAPSPHVNSVTAVPTSALAKAAALNPQNGTALAVSFAKLRATSCHWGERTDKKM